MTVAEMCASYIVKLMRREGMTDNEIARRICSELDYIDEVSEAQIIQCLGERLTREGFVKGVLHEQCTKPTTRGFF